MTPETYMRRYHGGCACDRDCKCDAAEPTALSAEELYPSCPLNTDETDRCGCDCHCSCDHHSDPDPLPTCCCKSSMVEALRLLCNTELSNLVDFDAFFFLTDDLTVGGALKVPCSEPDNICDLDASFRRFSPCNCDLIDVDGTAYFAIPGAACTALEDVDQLSLCSVKAIAFGLNDPDCPEECPDAVYRRALRIIRRALHSECEETPVCATCGSGTTPHCDCEDCRCDTGILAELASRNLSHLATLTVGTLVLQNVTVVDAIGSVLVLADEDQERIYFVCASNVEALG